MSTAEGITVVGRAAAAVERLVCHARLPLVAGLDATRPAVHVWQLGSGSVRLVGTVASGPDDYAGAEGWDRTKLTPALAWHPVGAQLVVVGPAGVQQWTPAGTSDLSVAPAGAAYRHVAFSPDGSACWAAPSAHASDGWSDSDAIDLVSGRCRTGPGWDTGVVAHPAGGLVALLRSDQGATVLCFASPDDELPAVLRPHRRALILDADGYEAPLFSPDGRSIVVRGNAYENSLEVFEFPSLQRAWGAVLGEPNPGWPAPPQWRAQMRAWSGHRIAFHPLSGRLLVGTPDGTVIEIDIDNQVAVEHDLPGKPAVTAMACHSNGQAIISTDQAELLLVDGLGRGAPAAAAPQRADVDAYLSSSPPLAASADLDNELDLTDGTTSWTPAELEAVGPQPDGPSWLRLLGFVNAARDEQKDHQDHE